MDRLYRVRVVTDIMVLSDSAVKAEQIAKQNGASEIELGEAQATVVNDVLSVPKDWLNAIPYYDQSMSSKTETRLCKTIVEELAKENADNVREIIEKHERKKVDGNDEVPESRSDPKPSRELDWAATKAKETKPTLRFVR